MELEPMEPSNDCGTDGRTIAFAGLADLDNNYIYLVCVK